MGLYSGADKLVATLLGCGLMDGEMFDDSDMELIAESVEALRMAHEEVTFGNLWEKMFCAMRNELKGALENRRAGLAGSGEECEEKSELEGLSADDMDWYINYQDTHVWLKNHDIWQRYFGKTLKSIENRLGLEIMEA